MHAIVVRVLTCELSFKFRAIIAVNQDPLGIQGLRVSYQNKIEVTIYHFIVGIERQFRPSSVRRVPPKLFIISHEMI